MKKHGTGIIRKLCAIILTVIISNAAAPVLCSAADSELIYNGIVCEISADGREIFVTGYTGTASSLDVPETVDGKPVTVIGDDAFSGCFGLSRVSLPDTVRKIGEYAFWGCYGLTSFNIPTGVTEIGDYAFSDCGGITVLTVSPENKVFHSSGNCVIETGSKTLAVGCGGSVIPTDGSVTRIGDFAFAGAASLETITLPDGIVSVGIGAFSFCASLKTVDLPSSVSYVGHGAFSGCTGITSLTVDSGNKTYHSDGNCIIKTDEKLLVCGCGASVIPTDGSVTDIGYFAFYFCELPDEFVIPYTISVINDYGFSRADSVKTVVISGTVEYIGENAFGTVENVYFSGTKEQFEKIYIADSNTDILSAEKTFGYGKIEWDAERGFALGLARGADVGVLIALNGGVTVEGKDGTPVTSGAVCTGHTFINKGKRFIAVVKCDTDGNGKTDSTDCILMKRHMLGISLLSGAFSEAADTDGNGSIDQTDYIAVKKVILGL